MPRHYRYRPDRPTRAKRVAWCGCPNSSLTVHQNTVFEREPAS